MMLKIIPAGFDHYDRLVEFVKFSSRGLVGDDRREFAKRASAGLVDKLARMELLPGEALVHAIALGDHETVGPNRNGDTFKAAACERYHDTFRTHGRLYYDHKNTDPSKSYGVIKLSDYNRPMGRIELIIGVNTNKEAADRNKGLVDTRYMHAIQQKNAEVGGSMACRVGYDVCSSCHNKAATRQFYCTEKTCPHGGCKHNLTKVSEDGHMLHVDNPEPTWFDYSHVGFPADRTAFALGVKTASAHRKMGGAELAEEIGLTLGWHHATDADSRQQLVLGLLANREGALANEPVTAYDVGFKQAAYYCPVQTDKWVQNYGVNPAVKFRLKETMKYAFRSIGVDQMPQLFRSVNTDRYRGTITPTEDQVIKCAAITAVSMTKQASAPGSLPSDFSLDGVALKLAAAQLSWCLAGYSPANVDWRIETILRINRGDI